MVPNERTANKVLNIFSDMRLGFGDIRRVAFYVVHNATPHDEMIARLREFSAAIEYAEQNYQEASRYE